MNSTMKKFIPSFVDTAIANRRSKVITKKLAKRQEQILSKVKVNDGVDLGLSATIKENADSIGRYARRHGVSLEISPANEDLFTREQMSVRKSKLEISTYTGSDDKIHSYPVINEYEIGQVPLDKTQDKKGSIINIKEGINAALENNKANPKNARYTRQLASFFMP